MSTPLDPGVVRRYLDRVGLPASVDGSVAELQLAHVRSVPFENLDIPLGRPIRLEMDALVAKIIDGRRGGYCFEQNALFASVLESFGHRVRRCIGRVRLGDVTSPRPATHMVLVWDDQLVDVGFGAANPLGPVPLGGAATYGRHTWRTKRVDAPEGDGVWLLTYGDLPLYTFSDAPTDPVDYVVPNHYTSTHPSSIFTQTLIAQRWDEDDVHVSLTGLELLERRSSGNISMSLEADALGPVLRERFGLSFDDDEARRLAASAGRTAQTS